MWQRWLDALLTPLLAHPWFFLGWTCAWVLLTIAVYSLTVHRRQLKWQEETAGALEDAIQSRTLELQATLSELAEKNKALEEQNTRDALTGVRNRAYFDKKLQAEMKRSRREQRPLGLIMLDIDHFKKINDHHGHVAGDAVIRGVASRISQQLKRSSDQVCRYGGEEFAIILPNTDIEGVKTLAEQIRSVIADSALPTDIGDLAATISAGCYSAVAEADMASTHFTEAADRALYQAKDAGRNQVHASAASSVAHDEKIQANSSALSAEEAQLLFAPVGENDES